MTEADELVHPQQLHGAADLTAPRLTLPLRLRVLLHLTTSEWVADGTGSTAIASKVGEMREEGWWIRATWQRNYTLWRNGRTLREACYPVVVLPLHHAGLNAAERDVFKAVELVLAQGRARADGQPVAPGDGLDQLCSVIASETGVSVASPLLVHARSLRRFEGKDAGVL